ncbi:uncharacterized protein LOC100196984 isoform X9 [Hydra vulgaris]|uniref:Uncharacterized protein LOC100196984 isoform X9 n=1 Tax=Hydra vulgaris TaxID=6087 RepID=A0ABM4DJ39_HYDVU
MQLFCLTFLLIMTGIRSEYIVERSTVEDSLLFNDDFGNSSTCNIYNAVVKSNNSCSCPSKTTFFSLNGKASCMSGSTLTGCLVVAKNSPSSIPVIQLNVTQQLDLLTIFQCNQYPSQTSLRRWKNGEGFYDVSGANALLFKLIHIGTQYQYTLLVQSIYLPQEFAGALLQLSMNLCGLPTCFMFKIEGEDKWSLSEKLIFSSSITTTAETSKLPNAFSSLNIYTSLLPGLSSISQFPSIETRSVVSIDSSLINYTTLKPSEILTSYYITKSITNLSILMSSSKNNWNFSINTLNILNSDLNNFSIFNSTSIKVSTVETMSVTMELFNSNGKKKSSNSIAIGIAVGVFVIGSFVVFIGILLGRRQCKSNGKLQIA